jgi:hemerythrin-like domain-containing protein
MLQNGRVVLELETPWHDGSTHVIYEPLDFVAKLAALIPRPTKTSHCTTACFRETQSGDLAYGRAQSRAGVAAHWYGKVDATVRADFLTACMPHGQPEERTMKPYLPLANVVERRTFVRGLASAAGLVLAGCATTKTTHKGPEAARGHDDEAEVTPGEDLMQEHGVLERVLLIYGESARRIEHGEALDLALVASAAGIIRSFVEEYHEHNEEQFVFPRLEAARRENDLVAVLRRQHQRGREVTAEIARMTGAGATTPELAQQLRAFERMYRPHAAREDTVLFPAFRSVVGGGAYRELGEQFEDQEHARFGEHGFEDTVAQVARLEAALGIGDLAMFTP